MAKLSSSFYTRHNVVQIAKELLGKQLMTNFNNQLTGGIIVETEAYEGVTDRASHAYNNRRTKRTEVMFGEGGITYVYLCYGIHHLFNVITNAKDFPHAILIRAIEPVTGVDFMLRRCNKKKLDYTLTAGPGNLSRALGIHHRLHNGLSLTGDEIWIENIGKEIPASKIITDTRVGVKYALEDAYRPYRFYLKNNPWVSKGKGLKLPVKKKS